MLCVPVTSQLSQATSQLMQHRPNCGATEDGGLLCGTQHPTPGAEEENSVVGGPHSLTDQGTAWESLLAGSGQQSLVS